MSASWNPTRRGALVPLAAALAAPALGASQARTVAVPSPTPPGPKLPDRYEEPLGIGLEGWPYPAPVRMLACAADGQALRMAYMDVPPTGRSNERTVVLLHGKNFDSSYWAGPIKALSEAGYRVVVPDQIGFNKSSKPDLDYSFELLAQLTLNLLSGMQIGRVSLVGHSTGGTLAVRLAAAYPERVDRLVLEDPIGLVDYRRFIPSVATETLVADERRRTAPSYRAFMQSFFVTLPPAAIEPFVEWRMRVALGSEYERYCRAAALTYQMIYREPVRDLYGEIQAPTLLMVGEKDRAAPLRHYAAPGAAAKMPTIPQAAEAAAKDLRKGTFVHLPDVGHVPHLEAPDMFRRQVLDFLAG